MRTMLRFTYAGCKAAAILLAISLAIVFYKFEFKQQVVNLNFSALIKLLFIFSIWLVFDLFRDTKIQENGESLIVKKHYYFGFKFDDYQIEAIEEILFKFRESKYDLESFTITLKDGSTVFYRHQWGFPECINFIKFLLDRKIKATVMKRGEKCEYKIDSNGFLYFI